MEQMERQMVLFLLRVFNDTARYVDQGGGSVKVVLLSTSKLGMHARCFDFLDLRKRMEKEEMRARDLFSQCGLLICL
jgi:hypothetical protein